jgi:hypothetical protein
MAFSYQILGQTSPAATTNTNLYTVPAANSAIASTLAICNQNNSAISYRVAARKNGAALSTEHYIVYDSTIPANDTITLTFGMSLAATDIVTVYANTASVSFTLFGTQVS